MTVIKALLVMVLILGCLPLLAQQPDSAEKLIRLLEQTQSYQADFRQTIYQATSPSVDVSSGQFWLLKPLQFNWSTVEPFAQQVIADGETLWIYDPDLLQATYQPLATGLQQSPAMILIQPRKAILNQYRVNELQEATGFHLTPIATDALFQDIRLLFVDGRVAEIQLLDTLDQRIIVEFDNARVNQALDLEQLRFKPPAGIDLFEQL